MFSIYKLYPSQKNSMHPRSQKLYGHREIETDFQDSQKKQWDSPSGRQEIDQIQF